MARATTYITSGGKSNVRTRRAGGAHFRSAGGLTLVEMLVVIGFVMVLAGIVVSLTHHVDNQSKEKALANTFALLKSALREYYDFNDTFPVQPDLNSGNAMVHAVFLYAQLYSLPVSRQVLQQINDTLVKGSADPAAADPIRVYDPWGTVIDYRYKDGDTFPEMISAGPDKLFGTPDDISSRNM